MIALDLKQETASPAAASLLGSKDEAKKGEGTLSFSELLKGVKEEGEGVQNGALVLSLLDAKEDAVSLKDSKNASLLTVLTAQEKNADKKGPLDINPEITSTLSSADLKQLIKDAKAFLKNKIISSEGFKRAEIEKLPKTLKGLVQVAKKTGIDISKITLEEVRSQGNILSNSAVDEADMAEKVPGGIKKESNSTKETSSSFESDTAEIDTKHKTKKTLHTTKTDIDDAPVDEQIKADQKTLQKIKETPLFRVQKRADISTEQIVAAKAAHANDIEVLTPKKRADDTLKLLLQGEKTAKKEGSVLTRDFSVATAKVIAPSAKSEVTKSLESLLQSDTGDDQSSSSKIDGLQVAKADSFEVKLNEAKQMIRYLSQDVKQAIDNYKAPFTRVKVQLNPQQLGDVELTVVQRGKNLHVNLSSNNAAINTLSMNANDLKVQLQNSGIQNATLNFNNNGSEFANGGQAQQHQQQRQNAEQEYNYFENEETNEEVLNSLEIIVPNYA
ncbi:flagellar hook-length control protein FliK [Sulfurimonas paralvinellae]|uniref:Flagellar hook-length control protein FliK n=1 Tax=Sulfurimonas paralvinellae TaxID=317658 RepID=A0A7M1B5L9_9BACT|nr:flagellar hook-length control protein FliK [Sulfurimonas paralvinellae]QOP44806.1 flagellar hook-length control protein FliK [Sulfurimonas paralvinellae]